MPVARRPGCGAEVLIANTPTTVLSAVFPAFGAWTALGTPANDLFLTRLQARRVAIPAAGAALGIEFAYGAGPTPIDGIRGVSTIADPGANDTGYMWYDLNTFNTKVPAGQSLQARVGEGVAGASWECWACGWDGAVPLFEKLPASAPAGAGRWYPTNTTFMTITSGAGAYGAWALVVDPAPNDMLVSAIVPSQVLANLIATGVAYQVGIGPAGAELAVGTFLLGHALGTINCDPPVWVKAGERLSIRALAAGAANRAAAIKVIDL